MILRYKLCDFIKIHDDYVNDPMKGDFQKTLLLFHIRGRVDQSVEHSIPTLGHPYQLTSYLKEKFRGI